MPFLLESNREDFLLFNKFEGKRNNYVVHKNNHEQSVFSLKRRCSSRTFRYGYLVTT